MDEIKVIDVTYQTIDDLCQVCVPPEKREDPAFKKGIEQKRIWAMAMWHEWGTFAKIAYEGSTPAGQIQYRPLPAHRLIYIYCIYIPEKQHWQKGIAARLLDSLIEDVKKPQVWFDRQPALALVTKTFPGEKPGQYSAHSFFTRKGFHQAGKDQNFLCYPLTDGFVLAADEEIVEEFFWQPQKAVYVPQEEDRGKVTIICSPSFCPFSYPFLKAAEAHIRNVAPRIPIRWISMTEDPAEVARRGGFVGCIVNAKPIKSFVLDKEGFCKEVLEALARPSIS